MVTIYPLNVLNSIVNVNARKSVCSFRLANHASSDSPVSVKFLYANSSNDMGIEFNISDMSCYDLCEDALDSFYPSFITIENPSEQFVNIYSRPGCLNEFIIQDRNGSAFVANGTNLEMLTKPELQNLTRSFLIKRI